MSTPFNAIVIEEIDGKARSALKQLTLAELPPEDVLIDVAFSTLNYKDGLALSGNRNKIARKLPMVGGIDLAGTVAESSSADWKPGDKVIVNGWGLSERYWGGYSQRQRVKSDLLIRQPAAFTAQQAMAIGTAGYTAMLCVMALEDGGVTPDKGEVVVTGAAGGVGSVAVALLAKLGYRVIAATGRADTHDYLTALGAAGFIAREDLAQKGPPLAGERWAGGIDTVGGQTLATLLAQVKWGGAVAATGMAGGGDLPGSVFPFILRNVALLGVDSVMQKRPRREAAWARLARDLDPKALESMTRVEPMSKLIEIAPQILAGQIRGRIVIDVNR
jgi:acrylyl-CoA reductase (NADPH)